eukprot:EC095341.1.p1 GENE.EC095341.1~~EC095341.1.p1  ORF type:complete len:133 (-),score=7.62 EC095341.1:172-570(-)
MRHPGALSLRVLERVSKRRRTKWCRADQQHMSQSFVGLKLQGLFALLGMCATLYFFVTKLIAFMEEFFYSGIKKDFQFIKFIVSCLCLQKFTGEYFIPTHVSVQNIHISGQHISGLFCFLLILQLRLQSQFE